MNFKARPCTSCEEPLHSCFCDPQPCKFCGQDIWWITTRNNRPMPVDRDGTSHMDTCPKRERTE